MVEWSQLFQDGAGAWTLTAFHNPTAIYDSSVDATYIAYAGTDNDTYIVEIDHSSGDSRSHAFVGTNPLANDAYHTAPTVCVTDSGHIHVFWGAHNSPLQHAVSDSTNDISSWTTQSLTSVPEGAYLCPATDGDDVYCFYRTSPDSGDEHGSTYPVHEYATIIQSTDNGSSFTDLGPVIDLTDHPDAAADAYVGEMSSHNGNLHITWLVAHGGSHNGDRDDAFHAYYDTSDGNLYDLAGNGYGSTITWSDHTSGVIRARQGATKETRHAIESDGTVHIAVADPDTPSAVYLTYSNGWSSETVAGRDGNPHIRITDSGDVQVSTNETDEDWFLYTRQGGEWIDVTIEDCDTLTYANSVRDSPDDKIPFVAATWDSSNDLYTGTEVGLGLGYSIVDGGVNIYTGTQWIEASGIVQNGNGNVAPVDRYDGSKWRRIYPPASYIRNKGFAWWRMTEGSGSAVADELLGGHDGSSTNLSWTSGDWVDDYALEGNGSDSYLETTTLGEFASSRLSSSAFALTIQTTATDSQWLAGTRNSNDGDNWVQLKINDDGTGTATGHLLLYLGDVDGNMIRASTASDASVTDGQPHRLVFNVVDTASNDVEIWVDGGEQSLSFNEQDGPTGFIDFDQAFLIHAFRNNDGSVLDPFNGNIDDFVVFTEPLTADEITNDYYRQPWV